MQEKMKEVDELRVTGREREGGDERGVAWSMERQIDCCHVGEGKREWIEREKRQWWECVTECVGSAVVAVAVAGVAE